MCNGENASGAYSHSIPLKGLSQLDNYLIEMSIFIDGYDINNPYEYFEKWYMSAGFYWGVGKYINDLNPSRNYSNGIEINYDREFWIQTTAEYAKTKNSSYINFKHDIISVLVENNKAKFYINRNLVYIVPYKLKTDYDEIGIDACCIGVRFDYLKVYKKKE